MCVCAVGNWEGEGRFKMWFNHGGAIEFGQAMLHAGQLGTATAQLTQLTVAPVVLVAAAASLIESWRYCPF